MVSEFSSFQPAEQSRGIEAILDLQLREIADAAMQIEHPLDRAQMLGNIVGHLHGQPGFNEVKTAAFQAYTESPDPIWSDSRLALRRKTVYEHIAVRSKDVAVLASLEPSHKRDEALALIALETDNESLIPSNEHEGRDTYFKLKAQQTGSIDAVTHIESPYTRVMAYRTLAQQFTDAGEDSSALQAFEAAWQDIPREPDEESRSLLYAALTTSFPLAERIPDPITRIQAYRTLYASVPEGDAKALENYREQSTTAIIRTIQESPNKLDPDMLSPFVYSVYEHTRDPALLPYITGETRQNIIKRDVAFPTVQNLGAGALTGLDSEHQYLAPSQMRSEEEAQSIEDPWQRIEALASVSARLEDGEQKYRIQEQVIESILAERNKNSHAQDSDLVSVVSWMNDARVAWRLLDDDRATQYVIAKLAEYFKDENLALQIDNTEPQDILHRDRALKHIAAYKTDSATARHITDPLLRTNALFSIYTKKQSA